MNILAIGAHFDDIELGCGGTLAKHIKNGDKVYVFVATRSGFSDHRGKLVRSNEVAMKEGKNAMQKLGIKNLIQGNLHLIENIKIFTDMNKQIFNQIIGKLKNDKKVSKDDLGIDMQILERIYKFAPVKNIFKNKSKNEYEVIELFEDISRDLINYDLEHRIQELESKFSKDLSEATFNELKELKKKQNIN